MPVERMELVGPATQFDSKKYCKVPRAKDPSERRDDVMEYVLAVRWTKTSLKHRFPRYGLTLDDGFRCIDLYASRSAVTGGYTFVGEFYYHIDTGIIDADFSLYTGSKGPLENLIKSTEGTTSTRKCVGIMEFRLQPPEIQELCVSALQWDSSDDDDGGGGCTTHTAHLTGCDFHTINDSGKLECAMVAVISHQGPVKTI